MCGIIGYVGHERALPVLLDGLRRLEYRGYDSAGVALLDENGDVVVCKRQGKLSQLLTALEGQELAGQVGVGHTRWATHGPPTVWNAHPHLDCDAHIAVVHNGIIENYSALRSELEANGHRFRSETDTEVLAHLIEEALAATRGTADDPPSALAAAVRQAFRRVEGAFAVVTFATCVPDALVAVRRFSPLIVGLGESANYVASDIPALLPYTRRVIALEEDDVALLQSDRITVTSLDGRAVERQPFTVDWDVRSAEKGGYAHFVRKEIDEQPDAIANTLRGRLAGDGFHVPELDALALGAIRRIYIVAAGTSLYAGLVGKLLIERWARWPVEVAIASEFRYGDPVLGSDSLVILITQSGETADTVAAMHMAKARGAPTAAITNVVGSQAARGADVSLYLQAGPEIAVVATKSFAAQLALLTALAADMGQRRGVLSAAAVRDIAAELRTIPEHVVETLRLEPMLESLAQQYAAHPSMFFLGRGFGYPIALEGALKLKEISYLHAEGYPAGELKHGPIAMLDASFPVIAIATASATRAKVIANIEEVKSRGARVIALGEATDDELAAKAHHVIPLPPVSDPLSPFVTVVPLQLFAYHVALTRGCDADQPRNLAKSVVVE